MTKYKNRYSLQMIKNRSMPDLIKISVIAKVGLPYAFCGNYNIEKPNIGKFDYRNKCFLDPRNPKLGSVKRFEYFDCVTASLTFRGQYELRKLVMKKLKLKRMPNVEWEENNNCLSAGLYQELRRLGITHRELKKSLYRLLGKQINNLVFSMIANYFMQFGREIKIAKIKIYLKKVEISTDIVCPINYEMARDLSFKKQFNEVVHNNKVGYFLEKRKHAVSKPGAEIKEGVKTVKLLAGYFPKKVAIKIYLKSKDQVGWLNRLESMYSDKSLDLVCRFGRELSAEPNMPFVGLFYNLRFLTNIHSRRVYKTLRHKPLSKRPSYVRMLKAAFKNNCGSYWDEIFNVYRKWLEVNTGRGTPLTKGACRRITALAKGNVLFRKSKKVKATYLVSNKQLQRYNGEF